MNMVTEKTKMTIGNGVSILVLFVTLAAAGAWAASGLYKDVDAVKTQAKENKDNIEALKQNQTDILLDVRLIKKHFKIKD